MAMHVLQLGPYPPPEGGVSRNLLAIRDEVERLGNKCSIVVTAKSSSVVHEPDVFHPGSAAGLLKTLARIKADVMHLHVGGELNSRVMGLAFAVSVFGSGKSVLTIHSGEYPLTETAKAAKPSSVQGLIFRRFSKIIAVNDAIADVMRRFGVPDERISVIAPFSLNEPDAGVEIPADIAAFCDGSSPMLLSVGGLERDYDPLFQIDAFKGILAEFPNAGLLLVGSGSMHDEVKKAVEKSGYGYRIMIPGNVDHSVVLHLIDRADVLLRMTLFDGDAISVREALFLGTPVIATDNGNRPAGVNTVPIGDGAALVGALKKLYPFAKVRGARTATPNSNIDAVIKLYEELC